MKYSLNKADVSKILRAFWFSLASTAVVFLIATAEQTDFGDYAFLVPIINVGLYGAKKFLEGN